MAAAHRRAHIIDPMHVLWRTARSPFEPMHVRWHTPPPLTYPDTAAAPPSPAPRRRGGAPPGVGRPTFVRHCHAGLGWRAMCHTLRQKPWL
eukprot:COSAG05_NODE_3445_length_2058_cov_20.512506_3_plen_91_part_00